MTPTRRVLRRGLLLLALIALGFTACTDSTGPARGPLVLLFDLSTPESATPIDTVRIGFSYSVSCGQVPMVDMAVRTDRVVIAAWLPLGTSPPTCRALSVPVRTELLLMPALRGTGDVDVVFRQPGGVDSVRTVHAEFAAFHRGPAATPP